MLQAISDVVRSEFCQTGNIELKETAAGSICGPVTLNKSGKAVVLKLDGLPPPLCPQQGCQLRYSVNDRLFPLFKTETTGLQAENGKLLADYILAMAKHHHKLTSVPRSVARGLVFSPTLELPKIGNPTRDRCQYASSETGMTDMKFARCRDGSYPLAYFCA